MKSLSLPLGLFFWGMVLKCLSEAMELSVTVSQAAVKWIGYGLWLCALLLVLRRLCRPVLKEADVPQPEEHQS
ncbi:hypothetical protein ACI2I2_19910 [Scandinavium sp. NPDC088450]|uniref:hypothetical protein n=1 Tax=Scandinavium sp. NPDC088450 TaxID=3364514 RepID=UPI0038515703